MVAMSKSNKNLSNALANQRQRFSIRKLSVGVSSVLLGTTLFLVNGGVQVNADSVDSTNQQEQVTKTEEIDVNEAKESANTTGSQAASQNDQKQVTNENNKSDVNSQNSNSENNSTKQADQLNKIETVKSDYDETKEADSSNQAVKSNDETNTLTSSAVKQATVNLAESKAVAPAKEQVTATINIYDDTSDPEASDPAFSITWTGDQGTTIKQAVQERIDNDMKGYTISPAVDNQSRISDIVNSTGKALVPNGSWTVNGGQEEYNKWLTDKNTNHKLAGYEIAAD